MVFVFDIDGTLLKSDYTVSQETVVAIKSLERNDHTVIFASGRMLVSVKKFLRKFFGKDFPVIAYNGGMVWIPEKGVVFEKSVDFESTKKIIEFLRGKSLHRQIYVDDKLYGEEDNEYIKSYARHADVEYFIVEDLVKLSKEKLPTKILSIADEKVLDNVKDELDKMNLNVDIFKSMNIFLDIVPKNVNKAEALKYLIDKLNCRDQKIVVFGDNHNDIGMFKMADFSVAVGNAIEELKKEADYIAPSNDEDGVYVALSNYFSDIISG
ncbi:hypothetical protein HNP65_000514 [Thermosipho japonicus]|uniref:Cof-type HAD-IIB family hydrolase n=1 Tax=Thermosipho japonicus TaxID=90323 RepID=A0A841GEV2_9BACT|nr:HAD family hydrolase [Thermosipho japonicus]MBB6062092.1 hypothetical protein [Thermosipho japonicus]